MSGGERGSVPLMVIFPPRKKLKLNREGKEETDVRESGQISMIPIVR